MMYSELEETKRSLDAANAISLALEEKAQGSDAELSAMGKLRETLAALEAGRRVQF